MPINLSARTYGKSLYAMTVAQRFRRKTIHTTLNLSVKRIKGQRRQGIWASRTHLARPYYLWAMIVYPLNICYTATGSRIAKKDSRVQFRDIQTGIHLSRQTTS